MLICARRTSGGVPSGERQGVNFVVFLLVAVVVGIQGGILSRLITASIAFLF